MRQSAAYTPQFAAAIMKRHIGYMKESLQHIIISINNLLALYQFNFLGISVNQFQFTLILLEVVFQFVN